MARSAAAASTEPTGELPLALRRTAGLLLVVGDSGWDGGRLGSSGDEPECARVGPLPANARGADCEERMRCAAVAPRSRRSRS
jgi:hypothetical protein